MHRRTLNRQLAADGETVTTVINAVRAELAEEYLAGSKRKLHEVAELPGFPLVPTFPAGFADNSARLPRSGSRTIARERRPTVPGNSRCDLLGADERMAPGRSVVLDEGVHEMTQLIRKEVVEQGDPTSDPKAFRRCLGQFSTGVAVMTTVSNGEPFGVTANSFSSLSMDPPLVLWSIAHTSRSLSAFTTAKHFAVNILAVDQVDFSQHFASSSQKKFEGVDWRSGVLGSPILPDILSLLECELETTLQGGDHVILVGRVKRYVRYAGNALLYAQGRYAVAEDHPTLLLKPSSSATAADKPVHDLRFMALLAYVEMYASDAFDKYRQSQGLNLSQSRVLFALSAGQPAQLNEVMGRSFLPRESAEDAIDSLSERGYVTRQGDAFSLTENGKALFTNLVAQIERFEAEQLAGIPREDIAVTRKVLEKLYDRLKPS
jgi:flavin reductase (DIM6/NTAB) family NADH-FMN oxidoreductase RutF/DNA-binding MarR family transcriptional regulator/AraC-like DNA-binding protein